MALTQGSFENYEGRRFSYRAIERDVGLWQGQWRSEATPEWQDYGTLKTDKNDAAAAAYMFVRYVANKPTNGNGARSNGPRS